MQDDIAIEAHISAELDDALTRLALARGKRKSTLVREALAAFVRSEEEFAMAVEEGRADVQAGRIVDNADVVREIRQLLESKR